MAIEFMEAVWQISPHKAEKLLVQLACADWADENGEFWPTYDAIARKTRTTKPGVIRIMEQLLQEGEIVLIEKGGGRGKNNRYQFGQDYLETVSTVRQTWKRAREKKGHRGLPNQQQERVTENDSLQQERVILNQEKGNPEILHIRNNRHEPSVKPSCIAEDSANNQSKHPAIAACREVTHRFPRKSQWLQIISALGECPDIERLRSCWLEWDKRGYNPQAVTWAIDWYKNGIPGNGTNKFNSRTAPSGINAANSTPEEFAAEVLRIHEAKYGVTLEMETA